MRFRNANKESSKAWWVLTQAYQKIRIIWLKKNAVAIRKRLERDDEGKNSMLILAESRIHRLARYYKPEGILPANWKYGESSIASVHVA